MTLIDEAIRLFRAGFNPATIARSLGRSTQRISEALSRARRRGVEGLAPRRPVQPRHHYCGRCAAPGHNARTCERPSFVKRVRVCADSALVLHAFLLGFLGLHGA